MPQLERIIVKKPSGGYVALSDVAEIYYKDSPSSIEKEDKSYQITISADYVDSSSSAAVKTKIDNEVISPNLTGDRKSTRLNSSHLKLSRMPSSA